MRLWIIPLTYAIISSACGFALPRLERAYLVADAFGFSVASAQAYLSAIASGMMALTGIVFSIAFVMVQFGSVAYSPRLVLLIARDRSLYHSLGIFIATFVYSLATLAWVDRGGSGTVPMISAVVVAVLLILSMLMFARLVERLSALQITSVLRSIGDRGRAVIGDMFERLVESQELKHQAALDLVDAGRLGAAIQAVRYSGAPRVIAKLNIPRLVRLARQADGVIVVASAVGDTVSNNSPLLAVHGARAQIRIADLQRAINMPEERTFEQDPKYPIRLLVDVAIKALSPAINDPTTAVQAIAQIEDLLCRLGQHRLDAGYATDAEGKLRLIYPMPTWEDYLTLAFDEIRHYGATSLQVMRRLRSALLALVSAQIEPARAEAVQRYLKQLDLSIERARFIAEDRVKARQEDRQGLGMTRKRVEGEMRKAG